MAANDYLKMKWSVGFRANDLDGNGYITMEDADVFLDKFIQLHNLHGETAEKVRQDFNAVWKDLFRIDDKKIDEETFVHKLTAEYNTDKVKFRQRVETLMDGICNIYDVNHDGLLSEDEYVITLKCHGVESLDKAFIQAYPQIKPGYIELAAYKESWVEYFTNDDRKHNEKERPSLIGFNIIERD